MRLRGLGRLTAALDRPLLDALSFPVPLADGPGDRVLGMGRPAMKPRGEAVALAGPADLFARYWRVVGCASALIRQDMLRAIRRRAEAG